MTHPWTALLGLVAILRLTAAAGAILRLTASAGADATDDYITAQMAQRHIPGMTVAVVRDGKVVKEQGYGLADVELSAPATPDTVYPIGSISKQFTAVGVMLLVHDGRVGLDDPVGKYVSALPPTWRAITVRQLLNQTSGIPEWIPQIGKDPLLKSYTLEEIAGRAAAKPLAFAPGTRYEYSNTNFNLLAGVIEKTSGKPYGDFLQTRLFGPLGMTRTGVNDPEAVVPKRAAGYDRVGGRVYNNILFYSPEYWAGAGGLQSTVGDLLKWDAALTGGQVLPPPVMSQMWAPPTLPGGAETIYGMGWVSQAVNGHPFLWHNGEVPGAMGFLGRFPDDHLTVALLSNLSPQDGNDDAPQPPFFALAQGLAALYVPALAPPKAAAVPDDSNTTAFLTKVLHDTAAGTIAPTLLTPQFQAQQFPAGMAQLGKGLAALGPLTSLTLVGRQSGDGLRVFRYRAVFGTTPTLCLFALDSSGKIATFGVRPE